MIPGEDKAFVFVSGGICPFDDQDVNDVFLRYAFLYITYPCKNKARSASHLSSYTNSRAGAILRVKKTSLNF